MLNVFKAVLVAAVVAAVVLVALPRIFGPTVDAGDAVEAYLEAHQRRDERAVAALSCDRYLLPLYLPELLTFSVTKVTTTGNQATVDFMATQPGGDLTLQAHMVRDDGGAWKWCGLR